MFTIRHRGVPVAGFEALPPGELVTVAVQPVDGYEPLQPIVRAASQALADVALHRGATPPGASAALQRGAALGKELELWDPVALLVPTDFVELTEWPGGSPPFAATIRLRYAQARVPARIQRRRVGGPDSEVPAA